MKHFTISLPDSLQIEEFEAKMLLAGNLYERRKVTLGQAADIAGISKRAFIELMGKYGFSLFGDSIEGLERDIQNA